MKVQEFSDAFDTLLNSYNTQASFGEGASKTEITLDEYEKSVLLTQAQDIIVKSYFYGDQNMQGQGFDDSTRRQVDFSSLIKTATLSKASDQSSVFDDRGIIYQMPRKVVNNVEQTDYTDVLFILNEKMIVNYGIVSDAYWYREGETNQVGPHTDVFAATLSHTGSDNAYKNTKEAEAAGWHWVAARGANKKEYVIVPLNYKEYDREMSKAYSQPLKKQAWRLFQNQETQFDVQSELIPIWNISDQLDGSANAIYRIRYVKRPDPIVLTDLPDGLTIDGFAHTTECTLNPILHIDILNKAVEIAITTRGGVRIPQNQQGGSNKS